MYNAGVPLCGTCFYKRAVEHVHSDAVPPEVWRRLTDAITALEALVTRISGQIDDLAKRE